MREYDGGAVRHRLCLCGNDGENWGESGDDEDEEDEEGGDDDADLARRTQS